MTDSTSELILREADLSMGKYFVDDDGNKFQLIGVMHNKTEFHDNCGESSVKMTLNFNYEINLTDCFDNYTWVKE